MLSDLVRYVVPVKYLMFRAVIMKGFDRHFLCMCHSVVDVAEATSAKDYWAAMLITVDVDACEGNLVLGWKMTKQPRFIAGKVQGAHRSESAYRIPSPSTYSFIHETALNDWRQIYLNCRHLLTIKLDLQVV